MEGKNICVTGAIPMNIINKSILNELESHIPHEKFVRNIQTFMMFLPMQIIEMESMLLASNLKGIGEKAHMLKGTCGQFGAMRLEELFTTIESCADCGLTTVIRAMVHVLPFEYQLVEELISLMYTKPQECYEMTDSALVNRL